MIYTILILGEKLLNGWCRMRMRPAWLVSYAFLYTTDTSKATHEQLHHKPHYGLYSLMI